MLLKKEVFLISMSKIVKIDIKGKYFIQLYNEWDKIVQKKKHKKNKR